jgi:hypothetical protein
MGSVRGLAALRFNPFPVRTAVDIGTGSAITLTVARVDARARAIRDVLYHTAVPLQLDWRAPGVLDQATWPAVTNALRMIMTSARSKQPTISEFAAVVALPTVGAGQAITTWRREQKMRIHFHGMAATDSLPLRSQHDPKFGPNSPFLENNVADAVEGFDALAFAAAAAAAKALKPDNVLVLRERHQAIDIFGLEVARSGETATGFVKDREALGALLNRRPGSASRRDVAQVTKGYGRVLHCELPMSSQLAHVRMVRDVQHRPNATETASPNPCQRSEYVTLATALAKELQRAVMPWVVDRLQANAPIVCFGGNGSVWNIAARAARKVQVSQDLVHTAAQFQFCGQTDVLLGANMPNPHLIIPQLALFTAICAALQTPRIEYLPHVARTHAMLVDDGFWAFGREAEIKQSADHDALAQSVRAQPGRRFDPHFDPDADREEYKPDFRFDERQWKGGN